MIEVIKLKKVYKVGEVEVVAIDDVSFSIKKGEFLVIAGPSGSGKSTLLNLIAGLDKPTYGEIIIDNTKITDLNDTEVTLFRRNNIGFIFQFFNLLPQLSAYENIGLPFIIAGKKIDEERMDYILDLVNLKERKWHKPDELSGGEQQRVAIARALVTNPLILLCDEPTGNLDSKTTQDILKILRKLCDELNQTILLVSHNPVALKFGDRILNLKDGRIVQNE